ncbi:hypothetical protein B0H13DRAFT_1964492 [Mycena leptocephala]|nr:hypothetical protein B0H13DRAFT_1964492 [Mycena leptocephala]
MANLPPRPGSPSRTRDDYSPRRGRPMGEPSRRLVDRLDPPPRVQRAGPPPMDSYVAEYDRRESFGRRMDFERRDRGWPDRRERSRERGPPPPPPRRSPEPFDRDRRPPPPHFDLRERPFERADRYRPESPPRWDNRRPPSPRLSDRFPPRRNSRSPNFRRSRSPPRRRPLSPPRRPLSPRPRSRSPPLSYPAKRIKLGNHSIVGAPRSPSPSRRGRPPPSQPRSLRDGRSRSPPRRSPHKSPVRSPAPKIKDEEPEPGMIIEDEPPPPPPPRRAPTPTRPRTPPKSEPFTIKTELAQTDLPVKTEVEAKITPKVEDVKPVKEEVKEQVKAPPTGPAAYNRPAAPDEKPDVQMRNASPPRHPRNRGGGAPARGAMYQRRGSRSPPRGPRGDRERFPPRGRGGGRRGLPSQAASFSGAGSSTYPTGPGPSTYPPNPSTYPASAAPPTPTTPVVEPLPPPRTLAPPPEPEVALPKLPPIPAWDVRDPERAELAAAQATSKAHRATLRAQYMSLEKVTRRALQELETANLELRAVEGRRKVADTHLEKARAGALGIEYIPPLVDIATTS